MPKASRVAESSTSTSSETITLAGAVTGRRTIASKHTVGETGIELVIEDEAGNWLEGVYTFTSSAPTVMTRTAILASSNADTDVTFPAGAKVVSETASASFLNSLGGAVPTDVAFSTVVPLTNTAGAYMAQQSVSSVLTFTPAAGAVRGAMAYLRLVADGVNAPIYSAFKEWGGSLGYDNRNGIENQMQFFFDGSNFFVSISQAVGAVPAPAAASGISLTGPTSGVVSTASTSFTVGVTPVGGTITGTVVVTPSSGGGGGTFSPTSVSLSSGTTSATFTYTPASAGAKTISVTNNAGYTNPSSITYTVAAAATAPATMVAPVATAGDTTASVALTAPSNGGSAITGYTVTSSPAGMTDSNAGSTNLTHTMTGGTNGTAYTFTATATNAIGTSAASPASNSVTLAAAAAAFPRMALLSKVAESGTGPYVYTSDGTSNYNATPGPGGVLTTTFKSGVDGSIACTISGFTVHGEPILGLATASTLQVFSTLPYGLYGVQAASYKVITGGTISNATTTLATAAGDILRLRRVGSTLYAEVARAASPTSFTIVHTWTGVSTGVFYVNGMIAGGSSEAPQNLSNFTSVGLS